MYYKSILNSGMRQDLIRIDLQMKPNELFTIYVATPIMTFNQYLFAFGGLIGLWSGLSLTQLSAILLRIFIKIKSNVFYQQIKYKILSNNYIYTFYLVVNSAFKRISLKVTVIVILTINIINFINYTKIIIFINFALWHNGFIINLIKN